MRNKFLMYKILKFLGKPIFHILYNPKIINKYNIPYGEPIIFAGNHKSYLDPLLLIISTKNVVHFLAKKELFKGFFNYFFKSAGCIPVDRKNKDKNATDMALDILKSNKIIGIFPEGTRNKTGECLLPFKFGAVSFASKTDAWIVPFGITGKYKLFRKGLVIKFGKPYKLTTDLETENNILKEKVSSLIKVNYEE